MSYRQLTVASLSLIVATTVGLNQRDPSGAFMSGEGTESKASACVQLAKKLTDGPWSCVGDSLTYRADDRGRSQWTTIALPHGGLASSVEQRRDGDSVATSPNDIGDDIGDDYDYWCENKASCTRFITQFIAEIKGNVAYGQGAEVWGNFDIVWRQNFDGPWNRYRSCILWDSGSAVNTDWLTAQVRQQRDFQIDPIIGTAYLSQLPCLRLTTKIATPSMCIVRST